MDRLVLNDIRLTVHLGVGVAERSRAQDVFADVRLGCDTSRAGRSDDFQDAIDYSAVLGTIQRVAGERPYALVEAMAEAMAAAILKEFPVEEVELRLRKPEALKAKGVGYAAVEIQRRRDG